MANAITTIMSTVPSTPPTNAAKGDDESKIHKITLVSQTYNHISNTCQFPSTYMNMFLKISKKHNKLNHFKMFFNHI